MTTALPHTFAVLELPMPILNLRFGVYEVLSSAPDRASLRAATADRETAEKFRTLVEQTEEEPAEAPLTAELIAEALSICGLAQVEPPLIDGKSVSEHADLYLYGAGAKTSCL